MKFFHLLVGFAALSGGVAWGGQRDVLLEVAKCANVTGAAERLKCFDDAVPHAQAELSRPVAEGDRVAEFGVDGEQAQPVRLEGPDGTTLVADVTQVGRTDSGGAFFVLSNGQVWRQSGGDALDIDTTRASATMKVSIEEGLFGTYDLKIEGRPGFIKVRRTE